MTFRLVILFSLLFGCTQKETHVQLHEAQKDSKKELTSTAQEDCFELLKSKGFLTNICNMQERSLSLEEARGALDLILSQEFVNSPEINSRLFVQRLIWNINSHILKHQDKVSINKVVEFLVDDCEPTDLKKCRRFNAFSRINNTRDLFIQYIQNSENKKNLETAFILGSHAGNNVADERLLLALSSRSQDLVYDERVAAIVRAAVVAQIDESLKSSLQTYLSRNEKRLEFLTNPSEIKEFVFKINESRGELSIAKKIEATKKIRSSLFASLPVLGKGSAGILIIYDLVFSKVITENEASRVLNIVASEQEVVESYKIYLQYKMLLEIHQNDLLVKNIAENINTSSIEFLNRFNDGIDSIRLNWSYFKSNAEELSSWISNAKLSLNAKVEIKNYSKGLDATIKTYSEYPHMFYLAYLLSKKNFALIFSSKVENYNIDAADIFIEILNPIKTRYTWLGYVENHFVSSRFSILNSLSYMLSSQTLETLGIDAEEFASYFVKNLNKKYIDVPSQQIDNIEVFFKTSPAHQEFKNYCMRMNRNEKVSLKIQFEKLKNGFLTQAFNERTFQMMSLDGVLVDGDSGGFAPLGLKDIPDLHEYANTDIKYVLDVYSVMEKSLAKVGQVSQVLKQAKLSLLEAQKKAKESFKNWMDYGSCMARTLSEEKKILQYVIAREVEYLKNAHNDVKLLGQDIGLSEAQGVLEKYRNSYLLDEIKIRGTRPLDQITSKGYLYSQFDMLGRVASYLKKYSKNYDFEIILPNQIEKAFFYKYTNSQVNANWRYFDSNLSADQWIDDLYRFHTGSFTKWLGVYDTTINYTAYISNLISLVKTSDVFSTDYFFGEYEKYMNFFVLGDLEKKMLRAIKKESLWDLIVLNQYFLNIRYRYTIDAKSNDVVGSVDVSKENTRDRIRVRYISNLYGLYDFVVLYMNEDVLGLDYWVKRQRLIESDCEQHCTDYGSNMKHRKGPLAQAEDFFKTLRDVEVRALLFPFAQEMIKSKYSALKEEVLVHERRVDDFIKRIHENYDPSQRVDVSTSLAITEPVLSLPAMNQVTSQKFNFHLQTQGCFKEQADCY
jgi:hypothetical protein